jgi:16S rRNA (uracil1498-N3)-methyltransferase
VTLHRFFLPPACLHADQVTFPPDIAHQIRRVLRLQTHDRIIVLDNTELEYIVTLFVERDRVTGIIEDRRPNLAEPPIALTLYLGLLKSAKLELVLQKCTEIGVTRFVPLHTERSVAADPSPARRSRFEAIVREAAEQSGRGRLPEIADPMHLTDALAAASAPLIVLWEEERTLPLRALPLPHDISSCGLIIGPEGGLAAAEVHAARAMGAHIATLGPRILRAETAAIVGAALLLDAWSLQ